MHRFGHVLDIHMRRDTRKMWKKGTVYENTTMKKNKLLATCNKLYFSLGQKWAWVRRSKGNFSVDDFETIILQHTLYAHDEALVRTWLKFVMF